MTDKKRRQHDRGELLAEIARLAEIAIFGTYSETYRTCGNTRCRCHGPGPKHGPHMYVSYRGEGKTTGYYVPKKAQENVRAGINAWKELQDRLHSLADLNKARVLDEAKSRKEDED